MKFARVPALCACVFTLASCQPVHVDTRSSADTNPLARTFEDGTPDSLVHTLEDQYDVL